MFSLPKCARSAKVIKNLKKKIWRLLGVEDTIHVTIEHRVTNSSFSLFSSIVCPFFLSCFTSTVSSTPSYSDIQISPYDDISRTFRLQCWWLDIKLMQSRPWNVMSEIFFYPFFFNPHYYEKEGKEEGNFSRRSGWGGWNLIYQLDSMRVINHQLTIKIDRVINPQIQSQPIPQQSVIDFCRISGSRPQAIKHYFAANS